jgi:hypothetical protein
MKYKRDESCSHSATSWRSEESVCVTSIQLTNPLFRENEEDHLASLVLTETALRVTSGMWHKGAATCWTAETGLKLKL